MRRFIVTAQLRRGSAGAVAQVLREGPPFDLLQTALERHEVFLGEDEIVFLFEGPHADAEAKRLLRNRRVLDRAGRIGMHMRRAPRLPDEVFSWERPATLEGVAFGPDPGPGDSDGGGFG